MPRVPQSHNNTTPVQKFDDTAYDAVVVCAENIDYIINAAGGMSVMVLYLGAFAVPPTEGHDGAPLIDGNFYLNTTTNRLSYYDASDALWVEVDNQTVIDAANAAEASRLAAEAAEQAAAVSEANAASSEAAALASEQAAATSEANALASENAAAQSEANALSSENAAAVSSSNSLASSQAAAQSEANALTSETNAANSASAALASEGNASASEAAAANSAVVAAGYAADAEAAFDNFNDLYLGAFAVDPTTDNDGQPLQVGASYWNTVTSDLRFWSGATWDVPEQTASQAAADALAYRDDAQVSETNAAASAAAASTSEANALASEQAAATSESNALASENAAALSESNAATSASQAATSASNSATSEANAAQSAADAQQSADDAANTLAELEWKQFVRNEANLNQMREQNKSVRAASGFDHYGQGYANNVNAFIVNEGLWTNETSPNILRLGRGSTTTGTSETPFPVTHIAGIVSELLGVNQVDSDIVNSIKFPAAPNGTVIYDSSGDARGTGNATLNLLTDVDPKYGNVAGDLNEAVARAFEGYFLNGNFRNSGTGWGAVGWVFNNGTARNSNTGFNSIEQAIDTVVGKQYKISVTVISWDGQDYTLNAGSVGNAGKLTGVGLREFVFTAGTTNTLIDLRPFTGGQSGHIEISSFSVSPITEEVVINRVDMFGAEFFLEEVSQSNPFVYPKGMIQSQATSMNGIATTTSNRPVTYYAVYDGDTGSQGRGVDFWAATDEQKKALVSDETNNIFMLDDGSLVQWRMRQRTIAGLGNGDWGNVDSSTPVPYPVITFPTPLQLWGYATAQGIQDTTTFWGATPAIWYGTQHGANTHSNNGIFKAGISNADAPAVGVNGECYFHVWGVVPRLNQGAYHPSYNPMGAKAFIATNTGNSTLWWNSVIEANTAVCFNQVSGGTTGEQGAYLGSGTISTNISGRPDGKFYDAIYASGQGGVNDHRLPSWDMSSKEEASKVFQKVVNGSYRGEEKHYGSKVYSLGSVTNDYSAGNYRRMNCTAPNLVPLNCSTLFGRNDVLPHFDYDAPRMGFIVNGDTGQVYRATQTRADEAGVTRIYLSQDTVDAPANIANAYFVASPNTPASGSVTGDDAGVIFTNSSVSGGFAQVDVVGTPANILATTALANGWIGAWNPKFHTNYNTIVGTRKNVTSTVSRKYTDNLGTSWGADTPAWDSTKNTFVTSSLQPTGRVELWEYTAFAKQTKEANNEPVLNGDEGLGDVFATHHNNATVGALWVESLLGKVSTGGDSSTQSAWGYYALTKPNLDHVSNKLANYSDYRPEHTSIDLIGQDSPTCKALWYQTANNQQVSLNFVWNELKQGAPITNTVTDQGNVALVTGALYKFTGVGTLQGYVLQRLGANASSLDLTNYVVAGGIVFDATNNPANNAYAVWQGNYWGDDSTIRVTNGTSAYTNLNGDTCLYGTASLTKPIGYTKNQARVGEQVKGVDL